ncbi:MAG: endonuclease V [Planctomycetota bacterium]|nr:MAG: endonuclease V [Planctomycetota bacterium]
MLEHSWELTPAQAAELQRELARKVERRDRLGRLRRVAGVDVAYGGRGRHARARAAVVVLSFPELELLEQAVAELPGAFPYVPGLLSFRESPAALAVLRQLSRPPDLLMCDAHGYAHPRRFGLACHLGLLTGLPSVGVAKSRLCGEHGEPGLERGSWTPLREGGETIGAVVRTRTGVRPVYVSIGHRVSLRTAIRLVLACAPRYRLPETTRRADRLAALAPRA